MAISIKDNQDEKTFTRLFLTSCNEIFEDWIYYQIKQVAFEIIGTHVVGFVRPDNVAYYAYRNTAGKPALLKDRIVYDTLRIDLLRMSISFREDLMMKLYAIFEGKDCLFSELLKQFPNYKIQMNQSKSQIQKMCPYHQHRNKVLAHKTKAGLFNENIDLLYASKSIRVPNNDIRSIKDENIVKVFIALSDILKVVPKLDNYFQDIYSSHIKNWNSVRSLILKELCFRYEITKYDSVKAFKENYIKIAESLHFNR